MIPVLVGLLACGGAGRGSRAGSGLDVSVETVRSRQPQPEPEPRPGRRDPVQPVPRERRAGNLVVHSPPDPRPAPFGARLRSDVDGALSASEVRTWVGIDVPIFVDLEIGGRELFILDHDADGFLAFYRSMIGTAECAGLGPNCAWTARHYGDDGVVKWTLDLTPLLSRTDQLEIQDVRLFGGVLYFNEACQSYSRAARGRCSSLVAVDPTEGRVLWRTPPLTSNNVFLVTDRYIVSGYGFTAEPDHLFVVRRADGRVVARANLPTGHEDIRFVDPTTLEVRIYPGEILRVRAEGFEGDHPRLVVPPRTPRPPPRPR